MADLTGRMKSGPISIAWYILSPGSSLMAIPWRLRVGNAPCLCGGCGTCSTHIGFCARLIETFGSDVGLCYSQLRASHVLLAVLLGRYNCYFVTWLSISGLVALAQSGKRPSACLIGTLWKRCWNVSACLIET